MGNTSGFDQSASAKIAEFLNEPFVRKLLIISSDFSPPTPANTGNNFAEDGEGLRKVSSARRLILASLSVLAFNATIKAFCTYCSLSSDVFSRTLINPSVSSGTTTLGKAFNAAAVTSLSADINNGGTTRDELALARVAKTFNNTRCVLVSAPPNVSFILSITSASFDDNSRDSIACAVSLSA